MLPDAFSPDFLRQLELLKIRGRRAFLGSRQGGHLSLKRGHGLEFSDYRKYELGDHPRHIDWGVYARSERLYIKRFQEEQDLSVLIILDSSASMSTPEGGPKWQRAREVCLALGYIALMQQDTVALAPLGSPAGPAYYGARAVHQLSDRLFKLKTVQRINLEREVILAASRVKFPGVAIFVSDFLMPFDEIQKAFTILRAKNLDLTAVQLLDPADIEPFSSDSSFIAVDSETEEEVTLTFSAESAERYKELLETHWKKLSAYFQDNRIGVAQINAADPLAHSVVNKLGKVGLLS